MRPTLSAAIAAVFTFAPSALLAAPIGFALGNGGASLVRLGDLTGPGAFQSVALRTESGMPVFLTDIDFRQNTGVLYGASARNDGIFIIDPATGVATQVASLPAPSMASTIAIDFNNNVDLMRVITTNEENFVFDPTTGAFVISPNILSLAYGAGEDVPDPNVFANAYRQAVPNMPDVPPLGGMQFGIDSETNSLITLANNAGTLATVGEIMFGGEVLKLTGVGGFDIYSVPGAGGIEDFFYALLQSEKDGVTTTALYLLSVTGSDVEATLVRAFDGRMGDLRGLAIIDSARLPAPVPLPAPGFLLLGGLAALGGLPRVSRA